MTRMISSAACVAGAGTGNAVVDAMRSLVEVSEVPELSAPGDFDLLVMDGRGLGQRLDKGELARRIKDGARVMLLKVKGEDKEFLTREIGLSCGIGAEAVLIAGSESAQGRMNYRVYELPDEDSALAQQGRLNARGQGRVADTGTAPSQGDDASENKGEAKAPLSSDDLLRAHVSAFLKDVDRLEGEAKSEKAVTSDQPQQQQWLHTVTLPWNCPQRSEHCDRTPQPQGTYVSNTTTVIVYLDEAATGDFQWMYVSTLGYMSTGGSGMNQNWHDERGWANGSMTVDVTRPSGFNFYQDSPTNVNNATQYTSSVSFSVGVEASNTGGGGSGSVEVSHSQTETITDWGIALNDLDNWTFYQNSPWDSRKETWQGGDMVDYNAGKARHEVKDLPALSTSVMDFSTMSVYYNNAISTSTVYVNVALSGYWNYVGIKNEWPGYCGEWWGQPFGTTLNYAIDLSLIS